jgi:NADH-quinone oxidoreductase subunit C
LSVSLTGNARIERLAAQVTSVLGARVRRAAALPDEICFETSANELQQVARTLRDEPTLRFEMLMDLAGVDYSTHGASEWKTGVATRTGFSRGVANATALSGLGTSALTPQWPARFAVAYQLLSITHNERLRLRVFCDGDEDPLIDSVIDVWACANWFEREAFDLYGILFRGHPDLRRLLTDYGFIGHPFRKDFPLIGNAEVRYDPKLQRVVYEPVSIEPRTLVPRVIRDDNRYDTALKDRPHG